MEQVYTPETMADTPFPQSDQQSASVTQSTTNQVYGQASTVDTALPTPQIASQVLGDTLNTTSKKILQEFTFTKTGALQMGDFQQGISGDLRIDEFGIVARNKGGDITISVDGDTGNAVFAGIISALSVISGQITLGGKGNGNGFLKIFNDQGNQAAQGDETGFTVYDLDSFNFFSTGADQKYGSLGADSASNITLSAEVGVGFKVIASGATFQLGASNQGTMQVNGNLSVSGSFNVGSFNPSSISLPANALSIAGNHLDLTADTIIGNDGSQVLILNGGFLKTAIVPTTTGYKALYTNESPEVWFSDFCRVKKRKWWEFWKPFKYVLYPDPLFLETVDKVWHAMPTTNDSIMQIWGKRKGFEEVRFEEKTIEQFEKNNAFWSQAK